MKTLRRIADLAWLNILQVTKDRAGLLTLIGMPLMLTAVFGTVLGGGEHRITVALADADRSAISAQVAEVLDARSYTVVKVGEEQARAMASSGEAVAAVVIPVGFAADVLGGVDTTVTVVKDPRSTSTIAVVQALSGRVQRIAANAETIRIVQRAYQDAAAQTGALVTAPTPQDVYAYADKIWSPTPPLSVDETTVARSKVRGNSDQAMGFQQYSLGFTLMFMLFMGLGSAGGFLDEREQGTLSRLLTTPTSKAVLVIGKVVGIYATVILQAAIMIGFGVLVFHVPWGDDPLGVIMIISTFGLAATGLGIMISALARTRGQVSAITAVGAVSMAMLGGAYWPLDIVGPVMRTLAMLTPVGWAMVGLTDVVVRAQGPARAVLPSAVLLGMATVFLAIGVSRLKME
ncbi:MAG TPA: ABC transporter permease [Coriobacteriia bacterium]